MRRVAWKSAEHRISGQTPFLKMEYTYDPRGLITRIVETEDGVATTIDYGYDRRGRLTSEKRWRSDGLGGEIVDYDLVYTYDQGDNRLTKVDQLNGMTTTYEYDIHAPVTYGHANNRLMMYEVRTTAADPQDRLLHERVVYDYALDGEATGNVTRVSRKIPDFPAVTPVNFTVQATEFFYNKAGEVQVISLRQWEEVNGQVADIPPPATLAIREFRGSGSSRYMMRERHPLTLEPDLDTFQWTFYAEDGDPLLDAAYEWTGTEYDPELLDLYDLGLVRARWDGVLAEYVFDYFHSDQTGSTRALSDSPAPPVSERMIYTAFGEIVNDVESVDTRFRWGGAFGAETFGDLIADFEFPYVRAGHGWYDPQAGRFLQGSRATVAGRYLPQVRPIGSGALLGGVIGGIVGGVLGAITGGVEGGVAGAIGGAIGGAITGAITGGTGGLGYGKGAAIGGAVGGAVTGALGGWFKGDSAGDIALDGIVGGVAGGITGGIGGRALGPLVDHGLVPGKAAGGLIDGWVGMQCGLFSQGAITYMIDVPEIILEGAKNLRRRIPYPGF